MFEALILFVPGVVLLAAVTNAALMLAGDKYARRWAHRVTVPAVASAFAGAILTLLFVIADPAPREVVVYEWMASGELGVEFGFLIDPLSVTMMLLTTSFSSVIMVYSVNYLHNEGGFGRFFTVMPLMVFSMLVLTMANNYALMFLGWEAVGLCMYLIVSFYYDRKTSARAGTQAVIMNRIGDAAMLVAIFLIFDNFSTLSYTEVFAEASSQTEGTLTAITACLLVGILGKSCQLPLGTWLSSAMEGPTPASAMIHAAVQDGIYVIARSHDLFDGAPNTLLLVAIVGAMTAIYGSVSSLAQTDIKGVLALSTTSQLGLMILACGLGAYVIAVFHMLTHACVKTYLFLTSPSIIHHLHGGPNPAEEGRSTTRTRAGARILFVGVVALAAIPFLSGWWRSDFFGQAFADGWYILLALGVMSAFSVAFVTARMVRVAFGGHGGRVSFWMLVAPLAVFFGLVGIGLLAGLLPGGAWGRWFAEFLDPVVPESTAAGLGNPLIGAAVMGLLVAVLFVGWCVPLFFDRFREESPGIAPFRGGRLYLAALNRFWLDDVYRNYVVRPLIAFGKMLDRFDTNVVDWLTGVPTPMDLPRDVEKMDAPRRRPDTVTSGARRLERSPRFGTFFTGAAEWIERIIFQQGVNRRIPGLGETIAAVAGWLERWVFQAGLNEGGPKATRKVGRTLVKAEAVIGRPVVAGGIFVGFLVFVVIVLGVLR